MLIINGAPVLPDDFMTEINLLHAEIDAGKSCGAISLSATADTSLAVIGQYYPISGVFTVGATGKDFTAAVGGTLTFNGLDTVRCSLVGTSDCKVNKASTVTYALFRGGVLVPGAETPHDFQAQSKTETLAICQLVEVHTGDIFQVYAKSDTINTTLTVNSLNVTLTQV